jgi:hypothetical protein
MRLPDDSERLVIAGHTGSGKTHEALHHLSQRSFDVMPWVLLDFKGDDLVASTPITEPADLSDGPPDEPGLYVVKCEHDDGEPGGRVETYLESCLDRGGIGLFVDEGLRLGQHNDGLRALLTQGRSKRCPLIFLTQRPLFVDTFALSESEYLQVFNLPHPDDRKRMGEFIPRDRLDFARLRQAGQYCSFWYDVRADRLDLLGPAPPLPAIVSRIFVRLPQIIDPPTAPVADNPRRVRV